jgi:hypothetical protein
MGLESLARFLLRSEAIASSRIGGSDWHPAGADFVPPPPEEVPRLVEDLADYLTGAVHGPLLKPPWSTPSSRPSTRSPTATDASDGHSFTLSSLDAVSRAPLSSP